MRRPACAAPGAASSRPRQALFRSFVISLTAFLTVVDLFATQAILPSLAKAYRVSPGTMGFAVNASTIGMAVVGLVCCLHAQFAGRGAGVFHADANAADG